MCLMLYLGAERPVAPAAAAATAAGPLALAVIPHARAPTALRDQAVVMNIGVRLSGAHGHVGCACPFRDTGEAESVAVYSALRSMLTALMSDPRDAVSLLGVWSGDERLPPAVEMAVTASEISPEIEFFSDVIHGWPIMLRVTAPTTARRAVAAGDG